MATIPQRKKFPTLDEVFLGFPSALEDGYTQIPNTWFEIIQKIDSLAELKVVLYVARHTWGYRNDDGERDLSKTITVDEFAYGRVRKKDKTRLDRGTGLGLTAIKEGIKKAIDHNYLFCEVDDTDLARIHKSYGLNLLDEEEECQDSRNPTTDGHNVTTDSRNVTSNGHNPTASNPQSDPRSEKETPEKNLKKETDEKVPLSPFFDYAFAFVKLRETVNLLELEKYMHRFMRVRGKVTIDLTRKNLVAWTGSSQEFLQIVLDLQAHKHIRLLLGKESDYSPKGRKPNLPVATVEKDYEEKHWYPMVIVYRAE